MKCNDHTDVTRKYRFVVCPEKGWPGASPDFSVTDLGFGPPGGLAKHAIACENSLLCCTVEK